MKNGGPAQASPAVARTRPAFAGTVIQPTGGVSMIQAISRFRLMLALSLVVAPMPALGAGERAHEPAAKAQSTKAGKQGDTTKRVGRASYYGKGLHGKKTAGGEIFDKNEMVAAHPSYPLGTRVRVTNLKNGRSEVVRIADRGPAKAHAARGVIIDVSEAAAVRLGFRRDGTTRVRTEVVEWGKPDEKQ